MANEADDVISEIGDVRVRYKEVIVSSEYSGTTVSRLEIGEYGKATESIKGHILGDISRGSAITTTEVTAPYQKEDFVK